MHRDAIKEEFWIFQNFEYIKFLYMQALRFWICLKKLFWLWQGHEYDWSKFHSVLNMFLVLNFEHVSGSKFSRAQNMARLWLYKGYSELWIYLGKSQHDLIIPQYAGIWLSSTEYSGHCQTFEMERFAKKKNAWVLKRSQTAFRGGRV